MRLLLDTHVWLWLATEPERVPPRTRDLVVAGQQILWSAVCVWEIATKHASGKLELPAAPREFVRTRSRMAGADSLELTHEHALASGSLPRHHADPFDRLLVAQAQVEGLTLVTGDPKLSAYDVEIAWN